VLDISDHSIVRYLERGLGIDLDELKKDMMPDVKAVRTLGDGDYPISKGCKARVHNNRIVTIIK